MIEFMLFAEVEGLKLKTAARALRRFAILKGEIRVITSETNLFIVYSEAAMREEDYNSVKSECFNPVDQRCGDC